MRPIAVVTGGAGFIGSHIVDRLLVEGYDIEVWDNLATGSVENLPNDPRVKLVQVDLTKRTPSIEAPALIVHCAAQTKITKSEADPLHDAKTNVAATLAIAKLYQESRLVFLSTLGAMFSDETRLIADKTGGIDESTKADPPSIYGLDKYLAEIAIAAVHPDAVCLRLSNVFGPRQRTDLEGGVVAIFIERWRKGKTLKVFGDGDQTRDFVHVSEVVEAVIAAARVAKPPSVPIHIASGASLSVNDILSAMRAADPRLNVRYLPARPGEIRHTVFPMPRMAMEKLGWTPTPKFKAFVGQAMCDGDPALLAPVSELAAMTTAQA
ncbi:MAG: UDP-glucose 4-epimerase [Bradymonadia bacterium]|jgi:UDP-glucose 4-epimerase